MKEAQDDKRLSTTVDRACGGDAKNPQASDICSIKPGVRP